jgi:hypothetical protein
MRILEKCQNTLLLILEKCQFVGIIALENAQFGVGGKKHAEKKD